MAGRSRLEISMAAEPESVRLARSELMRWFHEQPARNDSLAAPIAVAVSEAVGNVVRHAYPGDASGRVEIEAEMDETAVTVNVGDRGEGLKARPGREHNGMGLPVIGRVADNVSVESDEHGTVVSMSFGVSNGGGRRRFAAPAQESRFAIGAG